MDQMMVQFQGNEVAVTLDDISGNVPMENIEVNFGFEPLPEGTYILECVRNEIGTQTFTPKKGPRAGQEIMQPVVNFEFEVVDVLILKDTTKNKADQVGLEHRERFFIGDVQKDLGRVQALMSNAGKPAVGTLIQALDGFIRHRFVTVIKQRTDSNDKDRVYANINLRAVRPLQAGEGGAAAPPPTAAAPAPAPVAPAAPVAAAPVAAPPAQPAQPAAAAPTMGAFGGAGATVAPNLAGMTGS